MAVVQTQVSYTNRVPPFPHPPKNASSVKTADVVSWGAFMPNSLRYGWKE